MFNNADPTNADRREWARQALEYHVTTKGEVYEESSSEIVDLITDLLHLAVEIDQGHEPIESTLRIARMHYDAETTPRTRSMRTRAKRLTP